MAHGDRVPGLAVSTVAYCDALARQGDSAAFTLRVIGGDQLRRVLERAREKHYFEVPLPVCEYDSAPTML